MSRQDLTKVVQRSISDPAFRTQLATNAGAALRGYDLTPDEVSALRSRDGGKLTSFGIDQRMSKIFIDPGTGSTVSVNTTGSEPRDVAPVWVGDGSAKGIDVQSPDAADRNLDLATSGSVEPRDTAPTWVGDGSSIATGQATDEGQLTANLQSTDSATDVAGGGAIHQE